MKRLIEGKLINSQRRILDAAEPFNCHNEAEKLLINEYDDNDDKRKA